MGRLLKPEWVDSLPPPPISEEERVSLGLRPLPCTWSCDLSDDRLSWSRGVFELFGIAPDSRLDRRDVVAMYVDESREMLERLRAQAIERRGSFTMEAQIRRADGQLRWMLLTADVQTRYGRAVQLYGAKQDITHERIGGQG